VRACRQQSCAQLIAGRVPDTLRQIWARGGSGAPLRCRRTDLITWAGKKTPKINM
jgi:hypothetical protein